MHHFAQNFIISEYALPYKYIITIYPWQVMKRQHINAFVKSQFSRFGAMYLRIRFQNTDLNWQMPVMACAQISWLSSQRVVAINLKALTRQRQFDVKCKFSTFGFVSVSASNISCHENDMLSATLKHNCWLQTTRSDMSRFYLFVLILYLF